MHWLYRFFWLQTTFQAAFKGRFLAELQRSLRRGKLGRVCAETLGSRAPPSVSAAAAGHLPSHVLQSTGPYTGAHVS